MNLAKQSGKGDILFVNFNQDHRSAAPPRCSPPRCSALFPALRIHAQSIRNPRSNPHVAIRR